MAINADGGSLSFPPPRRTESIMYSNRRNYRLS
jgi:hypothetical protein